MKQYRTIVNNNLWMVKSWAVLWLIASVLLLPYDLAPRLGHGVQLFDASHVTLSRFDHQDEEDSDDSLPVLNRQVTELAVEDNTAVEDPLKHYFENLGTQIRAPPQHFTVVL